MEASVSRNQLFEAAFVSARREQANYRVSDLECSEYRNDPNQIGRIEIPIAVVGGFAVNGALRTDNVIRARGLVEYESEPGEIASKSGTHMDKVLKEIDTYTGGYSKEFWQQTFTSAGVDCLFEDLPSEKPKLVAGGLTYFKPSTGEFRSIFVHDKRFDEAQFFVRAKVTELEENNIKTDLNPVHVLARIESPESKVILARAAASCCIHACGCAGVILPSVPRTEDEHIQN